MNKGTKIFILVITLVILTIVVSVFLIHKFKVFSANKKAEETIIVGDNEEIKNLEPLEQQKITYEDTIGTLTIPDILLDNAPIKEGTELSILSEAIGHFTSTSLYAGNVGLASHNGGGSGDFFRNLNKVKVGTEIYYKTNYGTRRYVVKDIKIIEETDWSLLESTDNNRLTLITCVKGQSNKRLCVQAVESEENMINNQ
ncbi:MAG: class D sortase [Bacilli bacterium]